jgi:hypothetical protein
VKRRVSLAQRRPGWLCSRTRARAENAHIDIMYLAHHDACVRTTVAIDDDVFEKLKDAAAKRRQTFTAVVNETLRRGLSAPRPRAVRRGRFRVETFASAFRPGVDPLRLNQLLDDLEARPTTEPSSR